MPQSWKPFLLGIVCTMLAASAILYGIDPRTLAVKPDIPPPVATYPTIPPDAIKIQPLPPLQVMAGSLKFEGKKELPQKISGNHAKNIIIVNFKATGENAAKSAIKIVWMDGSTELISPVAANIQLPAGKLAKQIIVIGYSMYERKIFKDSSRPGTLEWEIRYEAVANE